MSKSSPVEGTYVFCPDCERGYYHVHYCTAKEKIVSSYHVQLRKKTEREKKQQELIKRRKYARDYYAKNKKKIAAYHREWNKANPPTEKQKEARVRRLARKKKEYWKE